MAARSRVTNETSASGSAPAAVVVVGAAGAAVGEHALRIERRDVGGEFGRGQRQVGRRRARTAARAPPRGRRPRLVVETRRIWRAALASPTGGSRSLLRVRRLVADARRAAPLRSAPALAAKFVSPSSDAKTAPPIRAAPHRPVRIVPLNHWTETRRRSTPTPVSPSTDSGGSLPRSIVVGIVARPVRAAQPAVVQVRRPLTAGGSRANRRSHTRSRLVRPGLAESTPALACRVPHRSTSGPARPGRRRGLAHDGGWAHALATTPHSEPLTSSEECGWSAARRFCRPVAGSHPWRRRHGTWAALRHDRDDFDQPGVDKGRRRGPIYAHTARRRLGAMTRLRSSSLIFGDQPPISIGGLGFDGSPGNPGRGIFVVPGCLTSESEERETWTAESLRAASS